MVSAAALVVAGAGIFSNDAALARLVGAQLPDIDERWQCEWMRYLVLDRD